MTKATTKTTTQNKKTTKDQEFEPNKVSLAVAALAAISLVILGIVSTAG